jgi:hypothetical protein
MAEEERSEEEEATSDASDDVPNNGFQFVIVLRAGKELCHYPDDADAKDRCVKISTFIDEGICARDNFCWGVATSGSLKIIAACGREVDHAQVDQFVKSVRDEFVQAYGIDPVEGDFSAFAGKIDGLLRRFNARQKQQLAPAHLELEQIIQDEPYSPVAPPIERLTAGRRCCTLSRCVTAMGLALGLVVWVWALLAIYCGNPAIGECDGW